MQPPGCHTPCGVNLDFDPSKKIFLTYSPVGLSEMQSLLTALFAVPYFPALPIPQSPLQTASITNQDFHFVVSANALWFHQMSDFALNSIARYRQRKIPTPGQKLTSYPLLNGFEMTCTHQTSKHISDACVPQNRGCRLLQSLFDMHTK